MNPIYVGNCSIEEVPGSKLSIKRGHAATLTRVYEGNANDLNAFLNSNPVYQTTDYAIPSMLITTRGISPWRCSNTRRPAKEL